MGVVIKGMLEGGDEWKVKSRKDAAMVKSAT